MATSLSELSNAIDAAKQAGVFRPGLLLPESVADACALLYALVAEAPSTKRLAEAEAKRSKA